VTRRRNQNTRTAVQKCNLGSAFLLQCLHQTHCPVHFNITLAVPHTCSTCLFPSVIPLTTVCPFLPLDATDAFRRRPFNSTALQSSLTTQINPHNSSLCSFFPTAIFLPFCSVQMFFLSTFPTNNLGAFSSLLSRGTKFHTHTAEQQSCDIQL